MAISIDNAYIETFQSNVRLLAQQGDTLLRRFTAEVHNQSEAHNLLAVPGVAPSTAPTSLPGPGARR